MLDRKQFCCHFIIFTGLKDQNPQIKIEDMLDQRFSNGGTRTTSGMPGVAKWYAKKFKLKLNFLSLCPSFFD